MKKVLKILGIITGIIFILIACGIIYFYKFFDFKSFETTLRNKVYKISGKSLYFASIKISFKNGFGVKIKNLKLLNNDNSTLFSVKNGIINVSFFKLLKKKLKIKKIILSNGEISLNFNKTNKKGNKFSFPEISLKLLKLKNFKVKYVDSHLKIYAKNLFLTVNNFSFTKPFDFNLKFNTETGKISIKGKFNFNNSFSPEKIKLIAKINLTNLEGAQFYSFFIRKAHFKRFNGFIKKINADYNGNLKGIFSANGIIILKNFEIFHSSFKAPIKANLLKFKFYYRMDNSSIFLKKYKIELDKNIILTGNFKFTKKNRNILIFAKSNKFSIPSVLKYNPFPFRKIKIINGFSKIEYFQLVNKKIDSTLKIENADLITEKLRLDNLSGIIKYSSSLNRINFTGKGNFQLTKKIIKNFISINLFNGNFLFSNLEIPIKNFKKLSGYGRLNFHGNIDYKNFKNINIISDNTTLKKEKIFTNFIVSYRKTKIVSNGIFSINEFQLNSYLKSIDLEFLKKYKIKNLKNFYLKAQIDGKYNHLSNISVTGIFKNNGELNYSSYHLKNINGKIVCDFLKNFCTIKDLKFNYNKINYLVSGKLNNFLKSKKRNLVLNIHSDGIDGNIFKKIKLDVSQIKNISLNSKVFIKFYPKLNISLQKLVVLFNNSNFRFLNFKLNNCNGTIFLKNSSLIIQNFKFLSNAINYTIDGTVFNIFSPKKIKVKLNINSNGIDEFIIQKIFNEKQTIRNLNLSSNILISIYPKFNVKLNRCKINFKNTNIKFKSYNFQKITGNLLISKNFLILKKLNLFFDNTKYTIAGKIYNIYDKKKLYGILNIKTDRISPFILKLVKINTNPIENVYSNIDLKFRLSPKLKINLINGSINIKNSKFNFNKINFSHINGKISIKNDNFYIKSLSFYFKKGYFFTKGSIEKNYINLYLFGKNFIISTPKETIHKEKKKKNKKSKNFSDIIRKIKIFATKFQGEIIFNLENFKIYSNNIKKFSANFKIKNKTITLKKFKLLTKANGFIDMENFIFDFSQPENFFFIKAEINDFDFSTFTKNKISGTMKKSIISISSKFKNPDNFKNNLKGYIFLNIQNGCIYKFVFLYNLFSLLNVTQIFKFRLPDLTTEGLKYKIIGGKFDIYNGVFKTEKFVLLSHSINLGFKGKFSIVNKKIKGELIVQPLQAVGNILGKVPLIGYIFGRKLILFYFKIKGTYEKPKLTFQPSKTITKKTFNIFKKIFSLPKDIFTNPEKILLPSGEKE